MNEVETHETDEECNWCGRTVVAEWGRYRCKRHSCITNGHDNDLSWDSPVEEIRAVKQEQEDFVENAEAEAAIDVLQDRIGFYSWWGVIDDDIKDDITEAVQDAIDEA